jgi:hypothetical protein
LRDAVRDWGVLGAYKPALVCFVVAAAAIAIIWRDLSRRGWRVVT